MRAILFAVIAALAASSASAGEVPAVQLDMPPGMPAPPSSNPCRPVWLHVDRAGAAFVNDKPVARAQLGKTVIDLTHVGNNCERVVIWPDPDTPYGEVLMVISLLKQAGVRRITMVSADEE
ncbi:MAG: biopolymer transporter ExbD [Phenylobacterium sp.]|nr:biopolymer transporter ExbD [Phenylobacterium sp.]